MQPGNPEQRERSEQPHGHNGHNSSRRPAARTDNDPQKEGGAAGSVPDMKLMLAEYYSARGLDSRGRPLEAKLYSLGLSDLAAKLYPNP